MQPVIIGFKAVGVPYAISVNYFAGQKHWYAHVLYIRNVADYCMVTFYDQAT